MVLVALGEVPRGLLAEIGGALTRLYGPPTVMGPAQQAPEYAFNKDRRQYHSTAILRRLAQLANGGEGPPVLGVTEVDLFVPDAPFVFGESDREAQAAVLSLHRLAHGPDGHPSDPERLRRRAQVEAAHELGHLLGLSHCPDVHCAMYLSHKPSDSDRKGPGLCASCAGALGLAP